MSDCPNCERLTRELEELASVGNRIVDQKMEIAAERDRLRAALERIIATESVDNDGEPMPETGACFIAREALKDGDNDPLASKDHGIASSAADETSACTHPYQSDYTRGDGKGGRHCHVCGAEVNGTGGT